MQPSILLAMTMTHETKEILQHLAQGRTIKEIAHEKGVNQKAIEKRVERLRMKFKCLNTTHLVAHCIQNGYLN